MYNEPIVPALRSRLWIGSAAVLLVAALLVAGYFYKKKPVVLTTLNKYSISVANSWAIVPHTIPQPNRLASITQTGVPAPTFYSGGKDIFYNTGALTETDAQAAYNVDFNPDAAPASFAGNIISISPLLRSNPGVTTTVAVAYFDDLVKSTDTHSLPTATYHLATADMYTVQHPLYLQGFLVTHHEGSALFFTAYAQTATERTQMAAYLLTLAD